MVEIPSVDDAFGSSVEWPIRLHIRVMKEESERFRNGCQRISRCQLIELGENNSELPTATVDAVVLVEDHMSFTRLGKLMKRTQSSLDKVNGRHPKSVDRDRWVELQEQGVELSEVPLTSSGSRTLEEMVDDDFGMSNGLSM